MHIGLAGPIDLAPLRGHLGGELPDVYRGPSTGWLARTWLDQGHRVTVYALSDSCTERRIHGTGPLRVVTVPQRPRGRARDLFRAERQGLAGAMREHPADVVSAHWTYEFALAAVASGLPAFVTARDTPLRYAWEMRSAFRWARHSLALPAVHRATAVSANSPYTCAHLRRYLGVRRPVEVIPNGVRLAMLPAARRGERDPATPVFASAVQGWTRLKNSAAVLSAFAAVRQAYPRARLLLMGRDHDRGGAAHRWAVQRGLAAGVGFLGPVAHAEVLRRLAGDADVLVHPSRIESFSMICAEAMAVGVPVVAGDRAGAVPWVVGDAGVLTDVTRPRALAAAMVRLAADAGLRRELAARGRSRVSANFDLDDIATAYTDWFQKGH